MKLQAVKDWEAQRNIGPVMAPLLVEARIEVKDLQTQSVEEIFLRFWQHHQKPGYVHNAYLYALHGAKYNIGWTDLPPKEKQKYKQFCKDLKNSWR